MRRLRFLARLAYLIPATVLAHAVPVYSTSLPAFPGAEGYGSTTPGGRGGTVYTVTSLNNSGSGTLRNALEASGPRIVVFKKGGTINLDSSIKIDDPYLTVAGQTAPGGGVQIKGASIEIYSHDIIIRGLRMRVGSSSLYDGFTIANTGSTPYGIIIDHCSMSWASDENFGSWKTINELTIQWCIISEALLDGGGESGYGMLLGEHSTKFSIHHNLFANNRDRNPLISANTKTEVINNLIYNWRWYGSRTRGDANFIKNHYVTGPNWTGGKGITAVNENGSKTYVLDNIGPGRTTNSGNQWNAVNGNTLYESSNPVFTGSVTTIHDVEEVYALILADAGAHSSENPRCPVDIRIVNEVTTLGGNHISSPSQVGGWPSLASGSYPTDSDGDGMPNTWENNKGLNPNNASDGSQTAPSGYTWVEDYINGLIPASWDDPPPAPPSNGQIN